MSQNEEYFKNVAEKLISQLKAGTAPWQKPWDSSQSTGLPYNPISGTRYKGGNTILLMSEAIDKGYTVNRWLTWQQANEAGGHVRKGEKGTALRFYKFTDEVPEKDANGWPVIGADGKPKMKEVKLSQPKVFSFVVFNAAQIEGLKLDPPEPREPGFQPSERVMAIARASGVKISHGGDRAFYRGATDEIRMPRMEDFHSEGGYHSTLLHEIGHATGHESRLDRDMKHPFGSEGYAKEELRAEIYSMMMSAEIGISHDPEQHAAYVGSWIKVLENDHREIFRAAADAEKMVSYVLELERKQEIERHVSPENAFVLVQHWPDSPKLVSHKIFPSQTAGTEAAEQLQKSQEGPVYPVSTHISQIPASILKELSKSEDPTSQRIHALFKEFESQTRQSLFVVMRGGKGEPQEIVSPMLMSYDEAVDLSIRAEKIDRRGPFSIVRVGDIPEKSLQDLENGKVRVTPGVRQAILGLEGGPENNQPETRDSAMYLTIGTANGKSTILSPDLATYTEALWFSDMPGTPEARDPVSLIHCQELAPELLDEIRAGKTQLSETAKEKVLELNRPKEPELHREESHEKLLLAVPYPERKAASALGAKWDKDRKSWYIPEGVDVQKFSKWLPKVDQEASTYKGVSTEQEVISPVANPSDSPATQETLPQEMKSTLTAEKIYLAVPYLERREASTLGAKWDKEAKSWYCPPGEDPAKFSKWINVRSPEAGMNPVAEFSEALKTAGLVIEGGPIMDGKLRRVAVADGSPGNKDGAYIGHLDGHPAGYIQNFRSGTRETWKAKGYHLGDAEKARLRETAAKAIELRQQEREAAYERASGEATEKLRYISSPTPAHPYLAKKDIRVHGVKRDPEDNSLCVPAFDTDGRIWSFQKISESGEKRFHPGGRMSGCMYIVGDQGPQNSTNLEKVLSSNRILIAEGFATAATLSEATGKPVVVAFSAGNLEEVARSIRAKAPRAEIVICGDDDRGTELKSGVNPGREKAERAAKTVKGMTIFPIFPAGDERSTDFNDLQKAVGRECARDQIEAFLSIARPKEIKQVREVRKSQEVRL